MNVPRLRPTSEVVPERGRRGDATRAGGVGSRISCRDLTLTLPVYGADARSLKKHVLKVTVGGRLGKTAGVTTVTALSHVQLALRPGDRLALIGHNGSGKTSLLRVLAGAYEPDEGQVEVVGRIASLLDLNLGIDRSASGYDNLRLRARIAGLTSREVESRLTDIADFTGLGPFLALPVKTYSAGMYARLAFAASTAVEADIVLMDEWVAVGDAEFMVLATRRLQRLVDRAGILVLASHDHDLLRRYCNKVVRMSGGRASPMVDIAEIDRLSAFPAEA